MKYSTKYVISLTGLSKARVLQFARGENVEKWEVENVCCYLWSDEDIKKLQDRIGAIGKRGKNKVVSGS